MTSVPFGKLTITIYYIYIYIVMKNHMFYIGKSSINMGDVP
jgi:hypothetical protein